ncbi:hypothetical protein [Stomatohabitans albus]|uniref:hypothetical protein n=1 Tax=Stomatohabitans albus TaxID=3110766 RepID=UPI00300C700E
MASITNNDGKDAWVDTLSDFQHHLDTVAEQVANGLVTEPPTWEPPAGLGPLPHELAPLAYRLAEQYNDLLEALRQAMITTRQELDGLHRPAAQTYRHAARPSMLDEQA